MALKPRTLLGHVSPQSLLASSAEPSTTVGDAAHPEPSLAGPGSLDSYP